jgi:hypothetical protein
MISHRPEAQVLSLQNDLRIVGRLLFGIADRADMPALHAFVVLALASAAALAILRSRVRAVEIVR